MRIADSASSTVKAGSSPNHNSPTLSASSNLSDSKPLSLNKADEIISASGNSTGPLGKLGEGSPIVQVRTSSNAQIPKLSPTPMPEATSTNPTSTSRRQSHGSIKPKSRTASLASSKKSSKEKALAPSTSNRGKLDVDPAKASPSPKKRGGFLSFLNCCSAPENANTVELGDQAVPAKKAKVLERKPGRQPAPVVKERSSEADTSTGESKENTEGNIGGPEYSEMKAASKPLMMRTRSSKDKVTTEKVGPPVIVPEPEESKESPKPAAYRDPPPPPIPAPTPPVVPSIQDGKEERGIPSQAAVVPSPPQLIEPEESVAQQGTAINDRTPQQEQRDSDIAMVDAPPLAQAAEDPANTARELQQAQINLPPPPPRNGNGASSTSNSITPNEKQSWLLPPLQPHFKGRKCLVLDLDETLVHSSFKVLQSHNFMKSDN